GTVMGWRRLTFAGSGIVAVLALASFSHPTRMAPATAACFMVLAAGFVLAQTVPIRRRSPMLGIAGVLVAAVCGIGLIWGSSDVFALGNLTHMAPHSAAGFVLLGIGAVAMAVGMSQAELRQPAWAPIGAGVFLVTIRIALLQAFSPKNLN